MAATATADTPQYTNRQPDGRWRAGVSANPGGRPVKIQNIIRKKIAENSDQFLGVLFEAASKGDLYAAGRLLDRVVSPLQVTTIEKPAETYELVKAMHEAITQINERLVQINERLARLEAR